MALGNNEENYMPPAAIRRTGELGFVAPLVCRARRAVLAASAL